MYRFNPSVAGLLSVCAIYLNTTHVSVQLDVVAGTPVDLSDLNTTHVSVQ